MTLLKEKKKLIFLGGGKQINGTNNVYRNRVPIFSQKTTSKTINNSIHNTGILIMSLTSVALNIGEATNKLINGSSNETYLNSDYRGVSRAADSLRPTIRYTPYPHTTTLSFGMPWYY